MDRTSPPRTSEGAVQPVLGCSGGRSRLVGLERDLKSGLVSGHRLELRPTGRGGLLRAVRQAVGGATGRTWGAAWVDIIHLSPVVEPGRSLLMPKSEVY